MAECRVAAGCFLCAPESDLVFFDGLEAFALAGLGPVVPYYSVVACKAHVPSASDAQRDGIGVIDVLRRVVGEFNRQGKRCIIAEHGRVPVCAERIGHERHCYHAHLLVFPGVAMPTLDVSPMFGRVRHYHDLVEALTEAPNSGEYYLLSDNLEATLTYSEPLAVPRQFLRSLLAAEVGRPELADWRQNPARNAAVDYASALRRSFGRRA